MSAVGLVFIATLACFVSVNEATSLRGRALPGSAQDEVMATMTLEKANEIFMGMDHSSFGEHLMMLVGQKLKRKSTGKLDAGPSIDAARDMLNKMIYKTIAKQELEAVRCFEFEHKQKGLLQQAKEQISVANQQAAQARANMLRASGKIMTLQTILVPADRKQLLNSEKTCQVQVDAVNHQMGVVSHDIEVMKTILKTVCTGNAQSSAIQLDSEGASGGAAIVECTPCGDGQPTVWLKHDIAQPLLASVKSDAAKTYIQESLLSELDDLARQAPHSVRSVAMAQEENGTLLAPENTCEQTSKCTVGTPSCTRLRDRFMVILGGVVDKKEQLADELYEHAESCKRTKESFENTISAQMEQLKKAQTDLAMSVKKRTETQGQSELNSQQWRDLADEYHEGLETCSSNADHVVSEVCALSKIRTELYRSNGLVPGITDCQVSEWSPEECTATCGGGKQRLVRKVIVHAVKGTKCPPLKMERSCNVGKCPVDCKVADWAEWSDCTAECGGGVRTRSRSTVREPEHGGHPCAGTEESIGCNVQACSADCVLSDWSDWGSCSKVCQTGHRARKRRVNTPARGTGTCEEPESAIRMGLQECNSQSCSGLLPAGRQTFRCNATTDLVILLDGSGSLGQPGWDKTKSMAQQLVSAMQGGKSGVNVALLLYSGPNQWQDVEACVGAGPPGAAPEPATCGIQWVSRLSGDVAKVAQSAQQMSWPARTTFTSLALSEAKSELLNGRQDANSVVVVITDAKPVSPAKTTRMAADIKKAARLVWISIGKGTEGIEDMKRWASIPWQDNLLKFPDLNALDSPSTLNSMISQFCDHVE